MEIHANPAWLNMDVQSLIEIPPIPLIKEVAEDVNKCDIIKIRLLRKLASSVSETYKLNISTFKNSKPE